MKTTDSLLEANHCNGLLRGNCAVAQETSQSHMEVSRVARSSGVTIGVRIPINWNIMTKRTQQRLRQIVGRDTRVIRALLGIIEEHEDELLMGYNRDRINVGKLCPLTLTALKVSSGSEQRTEALHDLKARFPRISANELNDCIFTAISMYDSYLKLRARKKSAASRPTSSRAVRRIPRWIFSRRFKMVEVKTRAARWWLRVMDSLDSALEGRKQHDYLSIPLKMSPFHLNQLAKGQVKALQIFTDGNLKWWASLAVHLTLPPKNERALPVAILGIDLGLKKAACCALLTPEKTRETRYFKQEEKLDAINRYELLARSLQSELDIRKRDGLQYDKIAARLRAIRFKRGNISKEYDRVLIRQLIDYISELSKRYYLYVAVGQLKNILVDVRRGDGKGKRFRRAMHSWAFSRVTRDLREGLAQLGWSIAGSNARFRAVPEAWTSIICWKCGNKGTRPRQNYFHCPACGYKTNADKNGSINIAARMLTLTKSLHSVRGLGLWNRALSRVRHPRLKAQGEDTPLEKSLLSTSDHSSGSGESAAVHFVQTNLLSFSDEAGSSDHDHAVERTVETLSVAGNNDPASGQEKEARST